MKASDLPKEASKILVSIPLWFNSNGVKTGGDAINASPSQFHYGSIQMK